MPTDLIKEISTTISKKKAIELGHFFAENNTSLNELIDLTFHTDQQIAFRAAWILENLILADTANYLQAIPGMIARLQQIENPSCQRHYAKIFMYLTAPNASATVKQAMQEIDLAPVVEQCFDWVIDPAVMVAVKSSAAEALFNMRHRYPWIADELPPQLTHLMRDGTAAIQAKGKRLLTHLNAKKRPK